jgi:hypothetical protein
MGPIRIVSKFRGGEFEKRKPTSLIVANNEKFFGLLGGRTRDCITPHLGQTYRLTPLIRN